MRAGATVLGAERFQRILRFLFSSADPVRPTDQSLALLGGCDHCRAVSPGFVILCDAAGQNRLADHDHLRLFDILPRTSFISRSADIPVCGFRQFLQYPGPHCADRSAGDPGCSESLSEKFRCPKA